MKNLKTILAACALAATTAAPAQTDGSKEIRAVTSSYMVETGCVDIADTYLTPLHYDGWHSAIRYERTQPMRFNPSAWIMQLRLAGIFDHTENKTRNATMLHGSAEATWGMMRRFSIPGGVTLGIGPGLSADLGVLYLSRNSNNPASAKAAVTLDAMAYASWSSHVGPLKFTLRYQPTLPVTGAFFSPDYGQLYYQIYLGEHGGLAHAAWWGNYFRLDNLVTADLHFGNTSLRLGYRNNILSSKVNDIVTQDITHAFVIGITTQWISLRPDSKHINSSIISAY